MKDVESKVVQPEPKDGVKPARKPRRRSRSLSTLFWALRGVFILIALALFTGFMTLGQQMHAPQWVRDRVEARLDRALGGIKVTFGDVSLTVHQGWRPRLQLSDVRVSDAEGQQVAEVSHMSASLAMRPLLRGQVQPKRIDLQGAQVALTRGLDGALSLTVGSSSAPVGEAPNLAQLIEETDELFKSPNLSALVSVRLDAITLDYQDLRQGRSWVLDGGHILLTRDARQLRLGTGFSVLSGRDFVSTIEANYTSSLDSAAAEFGVNITDLPTEDVAGHSPALAWMQVLRAPISGALRGSVNENADLGPVFATLNLGAGAVQPTTATRPVKFESARTYFTYDPKAEVLDFNEVLIDSAWGTVQADGTAYLHGVDSGSLQSMDGQFRFSGIRVNPADLFPQDLELTRADLDFQIKLAPFRMRLGQATIADDEHRLHLTGDLAAEPEGWSARIDAQLAELSSEQLLPYWPERLASKPREWVTKNIHKGNLSDMDFALRLSPNQKPNIYLDFDFDDTELTFAKTLPPIQRAQGQASLLNGRFTVTAQQGIVVADEGGEVDAAGTSFIIPDTESKGITPSVVRIKANSSVTAALSLLDRPPLQLLTKAGLPVDLGAGGVALEGTLALPLKKKLRFSDAEFHFEGDLANLNSSRLVPGFEISADRLGIRGDQSEIEIDGNGLFGAVPVTAQWLQPIGGPEAQRSQLTGQIELSPRLMDEINAGLPQGMLTGLGIADFSLGIGGGEAPELQAQSDLVGVVLAIPELGWRKPASRGGSLNAQATLGSALAVNDLQIDAAGLRSRASISFANGGFERVRFSSFELGDWLAVPAELIARGNAVPDIRVLGGVLNLAKSTIGEGGSGGGADGGAGPRLDVSLDRLQITESVALTGLNGTFETTGGLKGGFSAQVNGGAAVNGQVTPVSSRSAVSLTSEDAGAVLLSAGLLTQARSGSLDLNLNPIGDPGNYDVDMRIENTRIQNAPAMAALLNAISLVGLLDEMAGQGIFFSAIDSKMRITPTEVKVLSGSAVGPSMGLSFDGTIDMVTGMMNLRGAISPIYLLNAVGSVLTRKGEGVFAFNYTLTGPLSDPKVAVNPLSGLAPLFLRNLMRAPPPTVSDGPNAKPERPPPPKTPRGEDR
nr:MULTISPECIES: AsmA-like C-terminal region-containing protein [unclassified Ruegeria]